MQPGAKARPRLESLQLLVSAQESLLHHVLRVLFVAGHPKSQLEELDAVAFDEHAEGIGIAFARPRYQRGVSFFHHTFRR